jgi:hypothetical protein
MSIKLVKTLYEVVGKPRPLKSAVIKVLLVLNPYKASSLFIIDLKVPLPVVMLTTPKLKSVRLKSCELWVEGENDT